MYLGGNQNEIRQHHNNNQQQSLYPEIKKIKDDISRLEYILSQENSGSKNEL